MVAALQALSAVLIATVEVPAVDRLRRWQVYSGWDALADQILESTIVSGVGSTMMAGVAATLAVAVRRGRARRAAVLICALCLAVTLCSLPLRVSMFWESTVYSPLAATVHIGGGDQVAGLHRLYPSWYRFWIWAFLLIQAANHVLVVTLLLLPVKAGRTRRPHR